MFIFYFKNNKLAILRNKLKELKTWISTYKTKCCSIKWLGQMIWLECKPYPEEQQNQLFANLPLFLGFIC